MSNEWSDLSLCSFCQAMTHTINRNCGKCGNLKIFQPAAPAGEVLREIRVTDEAIAILHQWVKSGDITISQAIIGHNAAPTSAGDAEFTPCNLCTCHQPHMSGTGCIHCAAPTPPTGTPEIARIVSRFQQRTLGQGHGIADINDTDERLLEEALAAIAKAYDARFEAFWKALPPHKDVLDAAEAYAIFSRWYGPEQGGGDGEHL